MSCEDMCICIKVDECMKKFADADGNIKNCYHGIPHKKYSDCESQYCMIHHYGGCTCELIALKEKVLKFNDKDFEV